MAGWERAGAVFRKDTLGGFWDAGNILLLDLGSDYIIGVILHYTVYLLSRIFFFNLTIKGWKRH
jgi:hypothetical protein